jgi:hypothetical protein
MPKGNMNAAQLQREMAMGAKKAYARDQVVGIMKGFDRLSAQRKEIDAKDKHYKQNAYGHTALGGNYDKQGFAAFKENESTYQYNRKKAAAGNGTFKGGAPRSSMSKNLKIK